MFGAEIDQLKTLKLLYFAQRESLVRDDSLLFSEPIFAFQHGPVVKEVHRTFQRNGGIPNAMGASITGQVRDILDAVLRTYAAKSSWSLSRLTHAEYSWLAARRRKNAGGGERLMTLDDMRVDARRIRERRALRAGLRFRRIFNSDLQMFKYHLPDEASK